MADITYCSNVNCPFADCERHLRNLPTGAYSHKYVSIANFAGTCRDYIGHLVDKAKEETTCTPSDTGDA